MPKSTMKKNHRIHWQFEDISIKIVFDQLLFAGKSQQQRYERYRFRYAHHFPNTIPRPIAIVLFFISMHLSKQDGQGGNRADAQKRCGEKGMIRLWITENTVLTVIKDLNQYQRERGAASKQLYNFGFP
ncbi:hypothetical protein [Candidatus Nitrospira neomarina]|uniref:Uncharacterized protein n=1 Tax=Candidatus Nitrospira neomarina TaxID=3020899 RepID=A0AA96GGN4_9BACT|nr:hypothetical protein [Candidatus Nitrospira neomarina]WNM60632.1 hypothetical protein PQG83_12775 [Candidatus Nitrospira neomarina]